MVATPIAERHAERAVSGRQPAGEADPERDGDEAVEQRQRAVADHLDDRRGRADDRLDRAGADQDVEQGQGGCGLGAVEAEDVDAGEDQQAGRAARRARSRRGWRNGRAARPARGRHGPGPRTSGAEHILEGLADDQRHGRDLARDLEQAGGRGAARAGQHQVQHHRRRVDQGAAGEVGGQQAEAGDEQVADQAARQRRARAAASDRNSGRAGGSQSKAVIASEQRCATISPIEPAPSRKKPSGEEDAGDLLPEDAQADLGAEGAPGAGGARSRPRRRSTRAAPRRTGRPPAAGAAHRRARPRRCAATAPALSVTRSAIRRRGDERDQQGELDRAVRRFLVLRSARPAAARAASRGGRSWWRG